MKELTIDEEVLVSGGLKCERGSHTTYVVTGNRETGTSTQDQDVCDPD